MPKSKSHNKKYDPNKLRAQKMQIAAYNYSLPPFVKSCGQLLLGFCATLTVIVCIGLVLS